MGFNPSREAGSLSQIFRSHFMNQPPTKPASRPPRNPAGTMGTVGSAK